jgi:hypothetical protein
MERKAGASTVAVTREEVHAALKRTRTLSSEEEKALRMRHGVGAETTTEPLPQAASGNAELEDELLLIEMQLLKAWRVRLAQEKAGRNGVARAAAPGDSRTKDKIVRSLRRKK